VSDRSRFARNRRPTGAPFNSSQASGESPVGSGDAGAAAPPERVTSSAYTYEPGFGLPEQRVLGELSHELGNYFHKIYYWLEYLRDHGEHTEESELPLGMLEDTVERLEGFSRMALEYFAPAKLRFTKLTLGEIFAAAIPWLGGRHMKIDGPENWRSIVVFADPSRLHHVLRTVLERLTRTLVDEVEIRAALNEGRRDEFDGIEISFFAGGTPENLASLMDGIEMSVAEKFLKLHGGELFVRQETGAHAVGMFLPLDR